jgi:hypothetical protein
MEAMLYVVPVLIMAGAVFAAYRVGHRWLQIRSAWNSGLTAEARCLRAYTTVTGGRNNTSVRTTLHHVYEFRRGTATGSGSRRRAVPERRSRATSSPSTTARTGAVWWQRRAHRGRSGRR